MSEGAAFDLPALLDAANPWWRGALPEPLPAGHPALRRALALLNAAPLPNLLVIEGGRQTGKSRLLSSLTAALLAEGHPAGQLCRLALDHSPLRWCTAEAIDAAWCARQDSIGRRSFQLVDDLDCWPQREQDSLAQLSQDPGRSVVVATLDDDGRVERWRASGLRVARLRLTVMDFGGFLELQGGLAGLPPPPQSLRDLFDWPVKDFLRHQSALQRLDQHFVGYLQRGGYPAAALAADAPQAQAILREQVLPRILRWDAPTRHGVRRGEDLERTLHYLAAHAGGLLDVPDLCAQVSVERPTVRHFLDLLEQAGLLHRIAPLGYGRAVQRARWLITLPDPALADALLHRAGPVSGITDAALGTALASALSRHLHAAFGPRGGLLRYATLGGQPLLLVESGDRILPFARHDGPGRASPRSLATLSAFCAKHGLPRAYVTTRLAEDFGPLPRNRPDAPALMRIPGALLCLWLAAAESGRNEAGSASETRQT